LCKKTPFKTSVKQKQLNGRNKLIHSTQASAQQRRKSFGVKDCAMGYEIDRSIHVGAACAALLVPGIPRAAGN
jgi:hypothetical protein